MIRIVNTTSTPIPDDALIKFSDWWDILTDEGCSWVQGYLDLELSGSTEYAEWVHDTNRPVYFLKDSYERHGEYGGKYRKENSAPFEISDPSPNESLFIIMYPVLNMHDYDEDENEREYRCLPSDVPFSFVNWNVLWDLGIGYIRKRIIDEIVKNKNKIVGMYSSEDDATFFNLVNHIKNNESGDNLKLYMEALDL